MTYSKSKILLRCPKYFLLKIYCDTVPFKFQKFGSKKSRSACFHDTVPLRSNFSQSQKNKFKMSIGCPPPCDWRAKYNWRKAPGQSTEFLHWTLKTWVSRETSGFWLASLSRLTFKWLSLNRLQSPSCSDSRFKKNLMF